MNGLLYRVSRLLMSVRLKRLGPGAKVIPAKLMVVPGGRFGITRLTVLPLPEANEPERMPGMLARE